MLGIISKEALNLITTIYYHGSCPDGITAREVLKYAFPDAKFIPHYFNELKYIPENALFIDCSPKPHQAAACLANGCIIAEHHESFTDMFVEYSDRYPNQLIFGENEYAESGAYLATKIVNAVKGFDFLPDSVHEMVRLIALSDTWQKDDPQFDLARMYAGYISFFSNDFNMNLTDLLNSDDIVRQFGAVQRRKQEQLVNSSMRFEFNGFTFAFINELNMSNAAEILRERHNVDIIVGFLVKYDKTTNRNIVIYSLRSKEDGFDVSKFCKTYDGGGHKAAAGFSVPYKICEDPIENFRYRFSDYMREM